MRLGRQTTTPLQAQFLPPSARAINATPVVLQAVRKLPAPTDAARLLQATAFAQRYIPHFTRHSSICMSENVNISVSQNSPTRYADVSFSSRRWWPTVSLQGPPRTGDSNWRIRSNADLDRLINGADIARFMKAQRIRRLGHRQSMGLRMLNGIMGSRRTGRPRIRCNDMKEPNVTNWKELALKRKVWNELAEKAKTHKEL